VSGLLLIFIKKTLIYLLVFINMETTTINKSDNEVSDMLKELHTMKKKKPINIPKESEESIQEKKNIENRDEIICTQCKSNNIVESDGFSVCRDCGIQLECIVDQGQEWRYYGNDDTKGKDPSRCGLPTNDLLPKTSLGIIIGFNSKESFAMKQVRNMHNWNQSSYRESNLIGIFSNMTILSQNAGISSCIIEEAKYMFEKVSKMKTSRRIKKEAMKAASIMLACKIVNVPRNCDEICSIFNITDIKVMRKTVKTFEEIWFSIESREQNGTYERMHDYLTKNPDKTVNDLVDLKDIKDFMDIDDKSMEAKIQKKNKIQNEATNTDAITPILNETDKINIRDDNSKGYNSNNYLHRLCCKLNMEDKYYQKCNLICNYVEKEKILEKHNPISRLTTIIYYVSFHNNLNITKTQISDICKISDVTINKCFHKLNKYNNALLPLIT
jgi:transcription initiation factor TFIIIB Brf1 subunit/transcription initiation factor TFIIB